MSEKFYILSTFGPEEWGLVIDYVISGWLIQRNSETGLLEICRTGPYMPPITAWSKNYLVISNEFKQWLLTAGLGEFEFRPVVKRTIVKMDWHLWDHETDADITIPRDVELERFFDEQPHSPEAAEGLGNIWEWVIAPGAELDLEIKKELVHGIFLPQIRIHMATWNGAHIFRALAEPNTVGWPIVDEFAKNAIESRFGKYLKFEECLIKE